MADIKVNCECGEPLDEPTDIPVEDREPCPACGSTNRAIKVHAVSTVKVHTSLRTKGRRQGEKRPFQEQVVGDDLHRKSGRWMKLHRIIDRENDRYRETVTDPETGEAVHECDEPLSDHKGHGSDRHRDDSTGG